MATIRKQVKDAVVALLNTGTPGGVPQARSGYLMAQDASALPAILVYPWHEDDEDGRNGLTKHVLTLAIEVRVKSSAGVAVDDAAEPVLGWITKALGGQRGTTNTGPYHLVYEDKKVWDYEQMEHGFCSVRVFVGVQYQTKVNDAEAWA